MFETVFVFTCSVAASLVAYCLARVCLRDIWDGIAAIGLFIPAFLLGGDMIGRRIEAVVAGSEPDFSGAAAVFVGTLSAAAAIFALASLAVFGLAESVRRHVFSRRRGEA